MSEEIDTPIVETEVAPEVVEVEVTETPEPVVTPPPAKKAAKKAAAKKAARKPRTKKTAAKVSEEPELTGVDLIRSLAISTREEEKIVRAFGRGSVIGLLRGKHLFIVPKHIARGGEGIIKLKYGAGVEIIK